MREGARARTLTVMTLVFHIALLVHILAGAVGLAVFWVPLATKKGGTVHRRAGWAYVVAAATIAVTGFFNCARMLTDANPRNDRAAFFLLYIGVIAAASAQLGVRALRTKKRTAPSRNPFDLATPILLVLGGVALAAFGLYHATILYVVFAALGTTLGATQLRFWLVPPSTRREWFFAHMTGMGTSCITTVTAFVVVNAHNFGLGTFNLLVWIAPGLIGGVALTLWKRHYERRFSPMPRAQSVA
jgi:uncharacterized membrane protein